MLTDLRPRFAEVKNLPLRWHDWMLVEAVCHELAARILDDILDPLAADSE